LSWISTLATGGGLLPGQDAVQRQESTAKT